MRTLLLILVFWSPAVFAQQKDHATQSMAVLAEKADFACMEIKPVGICFKPNREPPVGIRIRFWQPKLLIETVKMPGDYVILEYGAIVSKVAKSAESLEMTQKDITSGSSTHGLSGHNLHFNEVHLYDYPLELGFDELCSDQPNQTLGIRYISEADSYQWRIGNLESKLPQSLLSPGLGPNCSLLPLGAQGQCMKTWGPLYPRQGFVIAANESSASVINSLRAVSIASNPVPHIVEAPLDFVLNIPIDKVQMVYPARSSCFEIGLNPQAWESGRESKDGKYVWIFWHQRECCV